MIGLSRLKTFIAIGALAAIGFSSALASPAQDLYDQATFYLETVYYGPFTGDIKALIDKYQLEVDKACASEKDTCAYEKVEPVIAELFDAFQDGHTYYLTAENVRQEQADFSGAAAPSPKPLIGFQHTSFLEIDGKPVEFSAFTPEVQDAIKSGKAKLISNDRLVRAVYPNSPGERAGLQVGDRWIGANDKLFSSITDVAELVAFFADFTKRVQSGETVKMMIVRGADRQRIDLQVKGEIVNLLNLPTLRVLPNGVGVLRIPTFSSGGTGQKTHDLIRDAQAKGVKALILDMRGNPGGLNTERNPVVGALIENPEPLRRTPRYNATTNYVEELFRDGKFVQRNAAGQESAGTPIQNPTIWKGPLATLIDGGCASACEITSAYLQRSKRGPLLGEETAGVGNTNTARIGLINGGAAGMPTVRSFWTDGTSLPTSIKPDIEIPDVTFQLFQTGRDTMIDKALEALNIK